MRLLSALIVGAALSASAGAQDLEAVLGHDGSVKGTVRYVFEMPGGTKTWTGPTRASAPCSKVVVASVFGIAMDELTDVVARESDCLVRLSADYEIQFAD